MTRRTEPAAGNTRSNTTCQSHGLTSAEPPVPLPGAVCDNASCDSPAQRPGPFGSKARTPLTALYSKAAPP